MPPPPPAAALAAPSGTLRDLSSLLSGYRLLYAGAIASLAAASFLNFLVPLVGSATIDFALGTSVPTGAASPTAWMLQVLGGPETLRSALWRATVVMVLLTASAGVFTFLKGRLASLAADGIARRLKDRLYHHLQFLPARTLDRLDTGDTVQRCTSDVETVRLALANQIVEVCHAAILLSVALPLMLYVDPRMTLVSTVLIPPIIAFGFFFFRKIKHVFLAVDEAEGRVTQVVQENLTGIRVVRAFGRGEHERARFAVPNRDYRERQQALGRIMALYWSISDFVCLLQNALVLGFGSWWVAHGELTVGQLFAFLAYLNLLLWPIRQMGRILTDFGKAVVSLGRLRQILDEPEEPAADGPAILPDQPATGRLEVRDLVFGHAPGVAAVDGLSFSVEPGETVAFLGPSGAGKSTLMHLLLRLYEPASGQILLDGQDTRSLDRQWVRQQFGVVLQEPFLFSKSLRENIRLGGRAATEAAVQAAAGAASIHDTIAAFPAGYDTVIGERGITLSGGQRQRVAIARALLGDPPLLILDDALSAVDGETETAILDALRSRRHRRTTLLIAHRLSTLVHADRILVLERGRLTQIGSHAELSAQPGLYRRLWEIQTTLETDFEAELAAVTRAP